MANSAVWTAEDTVIPAKEGEEGVAPQVVKGKSVTIHVGDTVRVHYKLIEKEQVAGKTKREVHEETHERTQAFEGIIISIKGGAENTMFTVRRVGAAAVGIERIFPLASPWIRNIEVKKSGEVRRAKLYYLRDRTGKAATKIDEVQAPPPAATG